MISDHWQGIGIALLLLEMIRYLDTREITCSSAVWISLCIVLSFGSAFVSAYAILFVCLGVFAFQLWMYLHEKDPAGKTLLLKKLRREDIRLVLICLAPFVLLLLWYLISGNLMNFYEGAYRLNREVYSTYTGGFGSEPAGALFDCFLQYVTELVATVTGIPEAPIPNLVKLIGHLSIIIVVIRLIRRNVVIGVFFYIAAIQSGVRVFYGYHGMPYMAIATLCTALCLDACVQSAFRNRSVFHGLIPCLCVGLMSVAVIQQLPSLAEVTYAVTLDTSWPDTKALVDLLLDPGEPVHITQIHQTIYLVEFDRPVDYGGPGGTPWTYEVFGDREIESLAENQPKLLFYSPNYVIWDYPQEEYAAELIAYIMDHYVNYVDDLWILDNYIDEATQRLTAAGYPPVETIRIGNATTGNVAIIDALPQGSTFSQFLIAEQPYVASVDLSVATYLGQHSSGITLRIMDVSNHLLVAEARVENTDVQDNLFTNIPIEAELVVGHLYELRFSLDEGYGEGLSMISPYCTAPGTATPTCYAVINNVRMDFSLCTQIRYHIFNPKGA